MSRGGPLVGKEVELFVFVLIDLKGKRLKSRALDEDDLGRLLAAAQAFSAKGVPCWYRLRLDQTETLLKAQSPSPETEKGLVFLLAGADGNRTHRGRDAPPIGFEDRERHQATNYSHLVVALDIYQLCSVASRALSCDAIRVG